MSLQDAKSAVRRFQAELDAADPGELDTVMRRHVGDGYRWRGFHPFYDLEGVDETVATFWRPLRTAMGRLQRREDIFMAGVDRLAESDENAGERASTSAGATWTCAMGHLLGLFDAPWLGIPPTGRMAFLRYVEFHRVERGCIVETVLLTDIVDLMQQAGVDPLPVCTGAQLLVPGPRTHDGVMLEAQDPAEGERTHRLIIQMVEELTGAGVHSPMDDLRRTWHEDMIWYGPAGIGSTHTLERYEMQHQGPFGRGLDDMRFEGHEFHVDEGNFGAFLGWPSLTMVSTGGFLGMPGSNRRTEMRLVDLYRREGDKLAENWVFIDLLHFLHLQGFDALARLRELREPLRDQRD